MFDLPPLFVAWLTGLASGFVVSVPVGPINITILHEGVQRGFRWALLIGLGATVMETIYCAIAVAGFSGLFDSRLMHAAMELVSFVLVLYLGLKFMIAPTLPPTSKSSQRLEQRLHPHTAFMTGFVRVLANPNVLLFWITLSATFVAHEWVDTTWQSKVSCVGGVAVGALAWFVMLSFGASRGHGRCSDDMLLKLSRVSGGLLVLMALYLGTRLVMLLAHHP